MGVFMMKTIERFVGGLVGLAVGDAVGVTLEFKAPGTFKPIKDMEGGGPFDLPVGAWTDDTSMALCLAASLIECEGVDARDQMERYVRWYEQGYMSSMNSCFDIGITTREALEKFQCTGEPFSGSKDEYSAGNGSIMRLIPVPLFYANDPKQAIEMSVESSCTTHGAKEVLDACRYFAGLLVGAVQGVKKEVLLRSMYSPIEGALDESTLSPKIREVARGSFKKFNPPTIQGTGYVVKSLEAALWAFFHSDNFEEGLLLAVNLGDDADTTGAVYGQLAGAYYGIESIPKKWVSQIRKLELIVDLAEKLYEKRIHISN